MGVGEASVSGRSVRCEADMVAAPGRRLRGVRIGSGSGERSLAARRATSRRAGLPGWLDFYDRRRPHGSLSHQPPLQRLEALSRNNLAGSYI